MDRISSETDDFKSEEFSPRLPPLNEALILHKTMQKLERVLQQLDAIGAHTAAAYVSRATDIIRDQFISNLNFTRIDAPVHGHEDHACYPNRENGPKRAEGSSEERGLDGQTASSGGIWSSGK